ncbi:MAG: cysteine--tRNA ligase [Chloroflexi bacterium]|uniref:Cysteine--tRNA ligase n=1 Tax=Candidatus Chlorohelix allophototropha TaxID=3003348 RepID=A0A8T7M5P9_9CHLR|nr:cysteine--tRNA ligase [Chloroflexota bacterium]WJW69340.1 cysteine--tRNA ligase [Chloroflexota bacterium L227-S17]
MKLYNTLTRQKEELVPLEAGHFKIYSCGPTVYRFIHIGNLRTFTMADWLKRALIMEGYKVTHVKNITDVGHMRVEMLDRGEDKLIAQARKEGKSSAQIAAFYTEAFMQDESKLNIIPADIFPRATQHVPEMLEIVQGLVKRGYAYEVDGNVFFDIKSYHSYGKLSGNLLEGLLEGAKDLTDKLRHNPEDFPLWKKAEPGREMAWDSPWGQGFPGWHIECSAMAMRYLGKRFDIHTGGVDNIFPHHEDELAQSEAFTGTTFVNYWVHSQHLLADGQKMAKSTGNSYTLSEIEARGFEPLALRYFFTTAHFRARINFTFSALRAAQTSLNRLRGLAVRLAEQAKGLDNHEAGNEWDEAFRATLRDDLNMPRAMAVVWQMLRDSNLSPAKRLELLLEWDKVLGFELEHYLKSGVWKEQFDRALSLSNLESTLANLVRERETLRQAHDYKRADSIRNHLKEVGYTLGDIPKGTLVLPRRPEEDFKTISRSSDAPDYGNQPDLYEFSINLISHNSRADLERCVNSIVNHSYGRNLELVILDNGSTDDTLEYLRKLAADTKSIHECDLAVQVIFADHNLGFATGRNASFKASRGHIIVMLDTSIELNGNIWTELEKTLSVEEVGAAGPYGLVTYDLREFMEEEGEVDAIEGYMLAFRRKCLPEIGLIDEKFRFYRMMDVYMSFFFKAAGYRVVTTPQVKARVIKHPHLEWYSMTPEEQQTRSKKNYDLFRARWHHGESLLVHNYKEGSRWFGHDHAGHVKGEHYHTPEELPPPGVPHHHPHQHWVEHDHDHPHYHSAMNPV